MKFFSRIVGLAFILLAVIVIRYHYRDANAAPSEIQSVNSPTWNMTPPGKQISGATGVGANEPSIDVSPAGTIMIAYNNWMTSENDRDPYFSVSTNEGDSWTTPAPIYSSSGVNSIQVDVAYTANGNAHAVWVELEDTNPDPFQETKLFYSRYNGTSWSAPFTLSSITSPLPLIGHPRIVAHGTYLDVVWEEGSPTLIESGGNAAIWHRRSSNNGQSWSSAVQISDQTSAPAYTAAIDIDPDGHPHAVWRTSLPAGDSEIRYTEGTVGAGNTVNWSPSINISGVVTNTNQPEIAAQDGVVRVSFTQSVISGNNSFNQWVYYTFCQATCLTPGNWEIPFNTIVTPVEVNDNSPFDVISDIVHASNDCNYIFFHGLRDDTFGRELIWDINSCDGWNPPEGWDPVTNDSTRAINPRVAVFEGDFYVTFQRVTNASENIIYFMSGHTSTSRVYSPIIRKK
ncbi:MAG: sialidase family protein [Candidatus Promineifilaceae bacterium]